MEELRSKSSEPAKKSDNKKTEPSMFAKFKKLDTKKKIQYVAILLVVVIMLAIYFASSADSDVTPSGEQSTTMSVSPETDNIEEKLKNTLMNIQGAGKVEIMITYSTSAEIVPAISVDTQTSTTTDVGEGGKSTTSNENTQNEVVTVGTQGGQSALVLREESPIVKGVLVIAEGADDIGVRLDLQSAVQTVLNVSPDQVDVYKMNNE